MKRSQRNGGRHGKGCTDPNIVDKEYLEKLWKEQQGRCAITGLPLELRLRKKKHLIKDRRLQASLDRIDNTKGYVEGNLQFICWPLNMWKGTNTEKDFIKCLELYAKALIEKK